MEEAIELEGNNTNAISLPRSEQPDHIDKFYKISLSEPVTELNNELCKYYIARHIDTSEEFYAIIFEKYNIYGIRWLSSLKNMSLYSVNVPIAYGITKISVTNEYSLVVIVKKYDHSNNLMRRIASYGVMTNSEIEEQIIIPITSLIQFCEKNNIEIGNISPSNVIFTSESKIMCREFFTSPPHFFQENYLLAPEIAGCLPYGRVTGDISADIYALGVVVLYALTGNQNWAKYSEQQYDLARLESGSFNILAGKTKISPDFKNLLKGILFDTPNERWRIRNILDWVNGKVTKIVSSDNLDAVSPIVFNEMNFQTCRALAYSMHISWDQATQFMKEERLTKWIQRSLIKTKLTESINEIFS
jgi:serine/threonine protein kinase